MKRLIIIGGGITGLSAALQALQENINIPIYESQNNAMYTAQQAQPVWLTPNGLHVLKTLGLEAEVLAHSVPQSKVHFTNHDLTPLLTLDSHKLRTSNGYPIRVIRQGVLKKLLLEKLLADGGEIHFERQLKHLTQESGKVIVEFEHHDETLVCDGVIGADGIHSTTRRLIAPSSQINYQGIYAYCGSSKTDLAQQFTGTTLEAWGDNGTRFGFTALDDNYIQWCALVRPQQRQLNRAVNGSQIVEKLLADFASYHSDIRHILQASNRAGVSRSHFGYVSRLERFFDNKVCLAGDAAHGMPPNIAQGVSLGLEDAQALVLHLLHENSISNAWQVYDQAQRPRAQRLQRLAVGLNAVFQPKNRFAGQARNLLARTLPQALLQNQIAKLYQTESQRIAKRHDVPPPSQWLRQTTTI